MFPKQILWLGMEKQKLNTKHAFTNQKQCTTTQDKHKKLVRFGRLLRHLAWKRRGLILILALHKFITYLLTAPDPHGANFTDGSDKLIVFSAMSCL